MRILGIGYYPNEYIKTKEGNWFKKKFGLCDTKIRNNLV